MVLFVLMDRPLLTALVSSHHKSLQDTALSSINGSSQKNRQRSQRCQKWNAKTQAGRTTLHRQYHKDYDRLPRRSWKATCLAVVFENFSCGVWDAFGQEMAQILRDLGATRFVQDVARRCRCSLCFAQKGGFPLPGHHWSLISSLQ